MTTLSVGQTISWQTRPEVHQDHGGYLTTKPMIGCVRSVHEGFVMVGTNLMLPPDILDRKGLSFEQRFAVEISNPSIKLLQE